MYCTMHWIVCQSNPQFIAELHIHLSHIIGTCYQSYAFYGFLKEKDPCPWQI